MAKNAGKLAGLAALAGAAYMMSRGKDSGTTDSNPTRAARPTDTKTGDADNTTAAAFPSGIMGGARQKDKVESKPVVAPAVKTENLKPVSEPSDKSVKLAPENRDLEAGTSRGSRKSESTVSSSEEGMKNYKPRRTPEASTTSSSEEGMKNYKPRYTPPSSTASSTPDGMSGYKTRAGSAAGAGRGSVNPSSVTATDSRLDEAGMSRGTRTTSTGGAGRGSVNPSVVTPSGSRDLESGMSRGTRPSAVGSGRGTVNPTSVTPQQSSRDAEATMSRGRRQEQSGPGQAQIDTVRRLQSAAKVPSTKAGMPGYDEAGRPTMAGRRGYDEAGNPMKKGGAVKKMASGGMTSKVSSASKRADGIASRGKTRCKMY